MKFSIPWHEACLLNVRSNVSKRKAEAACLVASAEKDEARLAHYERQISEAKRLGKDGFDSDKFMRP